MIPFNDEVRNDLVNAMAKVRAIVAGCMESDEDAIILLGRLTRVDIGILSALTKPSDNTQLQYSVLMDSLLELRQAIKSGNFDAVESMALHWHDQAQQAEDDIVLSETEFER